MDIKEFIESQMSGVVFRRHGQPITYDNATFVEHLPYTTNEITVSDAKVTDNVGSLILAGLITRARPPLERILLHSNSIGNSTCKILCLASQIVPLFIQVLDLSNNSIGDDGFDFLIGVAEHTPLRSLNLHNNSLTSKSLMKLTDCNDTRLLQVKLGLNLYTEEDIEDWYAKSFTTKFKKLSRIELACWATSSRSYEQTIGICRVVIVLHELK